jgi:hypothetical protein
MVILSHNSARSTGSSTNETGQGTGIDKAPKREGLEKMILLASRGHVISE